MTINNSLRYGHNAPILFVIFVLHGRNAKQWSIPHKLLKIICGIQLYTISKGSFGLVNDIYTKVQVRVGFQPILKIFSFSQYGKYYND